MMFRKGLMAIATIGALWISVATAQDAVSDAQNKLLAKRAADADCFRKLAETVYGMRLSSNTYVRDFVAENDEIRTAVDEFVKGVRLGPPRYYEDGVCEVDAEVTVAKLVTALKEIHTQHYHGNVVHSTDFEHITQTVKSDVIRVTGSGAPRAEVPAAYAAAVEPLPSDYRPTMNVPAIWKTVGPQGRLMAFRAAEVDAVRRLLERIKGLRLNSSTLVRDFIAESDEIRTQAEGIVVGASEVSRYLHNDELIAEVTMEVQVEKVFTKLKELHSQHYHGNDVTSTDFTNVQKTVKRQTIQETGSGVPPARFLTEARGAGAAMPDWFGQRLSATGQGTDPNMNTAQGKLRAQQAARMDAIRKLAEQVYGLRIDSSTTVHDFVTKADEVLAQVDGVISGAIAEETKIESDTATVTVSIPGADIWSVVNQQTMIMQRRG